MSDKTLAATISSETIAEKQCILCGATAGLTETAAGTICPDCIALTRRIAENPELLQILARTAGIAPPSAKQKEMPDVLDGIRFRTTDRDRNIWYVSVSEIEGRPVELFASSAFESEQQLQAKLSNLTTITRLTSLILRHIFLGEQLSLGKVLTQLQRSSRQPNDIPEMLARILAHYETGKGKKQLFDETEKEELIP
ncbi:hypothetical protein JWG39_15035 [Desulforhopalus vacuolatus]|uniref:TSCPD domain-containing protein n=1 Tax=Desulforhopalus vacuolatus TaxID=40414 RepID=UPI0019632959|nr:hypothetical protein [Desulforhopalus vacuolatus]MBM9521135.1 hypothetical protein [Desulforhopalus vacuolatus]